MVLNILINIIALIMLGGAFFLGIKVANNSKEESKKTIYDMQQNYMKVLHDYINREYICEIHQKLFDSLMTNNSTSDSVRAIQSLSDPNILLKMSTAITTNILSRMSLDIKNAFYRVYERSEGSLTDYVGRWVFFGIRTIVTRLTSEIEFARSLNASDNYNVNDLVNKLILEQELEIYNVLGITKKEISSDIPKNETKALGAS